VFSDLVVAKIMMVMDDDFNVINADDLDILVKNLKIKRQMVLNWIKRRKSIESGGNMGAGGGYPLAKLYMLPQKCTLEVDLSALSVQVIAEVATVAPANGFADTTSAPFRYDMYLFHDLCQ
jgi:hypothetical protein